MKFNIRIPAILRNFYFTTLVLFLVWMVFFDANDFYTQFRNWNKLRAAQRQKAFYQQKIDEVKKSREEVLGTNQLLEKYAREQYLMKKPTEDVYVVEEDR